jgi:hypothetical protein
MPWWQRTPLTWKFYRTKQSPKFYRSFHSQLKTQKVSYKYERNFTFMTQSHLLNVNSVLKTSYLKESKQRAPPVSHHLQQTVEVFAVCCLTIWHTEWKCQKIQHRWHHQCPSTMALEHHKCMHCKNAICCFYGFQKWSVDLVACNISLNTWTADSHINISLLWHNDK